MLIEMSGYSVTLQRKPIKNMNLRIKRSGEVRISAPMKTSIDMIHTFLHQKRSWIETHRYRLQQLEQDAAQHLNTGESIPFLGFPYALYLHDTMTHPYVQLSDNQIHFFVKPGASQAHKALLLTKFYRTQMETLMPPLLDKWQSTMGVTVTQVSIKHMKSRWGSCNPTKKHITLNLRLIEKPLVFLEYVIVHELVHLFEASHNQRFYTLMSHYLPNWKQIKKQFSS